MAIGQQVTKPGMGSGAPAPLPSGGMQGTNTGYVQPGSQFSQQSIQRSAQQRVPFQGQFNGNPRGANNMGRRNNNPFGFQGQGMAPAWSQQNNLGRYRPPTMNGMGGYNSNQWNDMGGMDYNLPGSYGSPLGQGQFAPMPRQFQQFMMGGMGGGFGGMGLDRMRQQQIADFGMGGQEWFIPGPDIDFLTGNRFRGGGLYPDTNFLGGGGSYEDYRNNWQGSNRFANGQFGTTQVIPGEDIPLSEEEWRASQGGGTPPSYDEWRGGFATDMMMRSPEEDAAREQGFRDRYNEEFGQQGGSIPPGKDGRPLMEQPQPAPTWDSPFNRSYNMAALRQMMGGG